MIKEFCDVCGKELLSTDNKVTHRVRTHFKVRNKRIGIEVLIGCGEGESMLTWNSGALCKSCLLTILTTALR